MVASQSWCHFKYYMTPKGEYVGYETDNFTWCGNTDVVGSSELCTKHNQTVPSPRTPPHGYSPLKLPGQRPPQAPPR